jgi:HAUS augmin-like complex subunit 3
MLEEGSIDDRDTFLHAVRDILSTHSGAQAMTPSYVSAYGLVEQISDLQNELEYLHHELENVLPRERKRCIDELCRMIQTLEQILSVPFTYVQPTLTPWVHSFSYVPTLPCHFVVCSDVLLYLCMIYHSL